MLRGSLKIGSAFGIGIYIHWSFILLPLWVLFTTRDADGPLSRPVMMVLVAAIFGCVVLHELGHALTARRYGIGTRDITLYPIGGVARLERMTERPWEEFWIAVAGPAVNVVIAAALLGVVVVTGSVFTLPGLLDTVPGTFLISLLAANIALVLFNLLPAFPMDGGRVLRAILAMNMDRLRATEIAAKVGIAMALLIGVGGYSYFENPMLILIAGFVFFAGQAEAAALRQREALRRRSEPIEVLPVEPVKPEPLAPIYPGFTGVTWNPGLRAWIRWHNGRPIDAYRVE
jgi:Zn-dependent protease